MDALLGYERIEDDAPNDYHEFVNWLAEHQGKRILIHEMMPGEFAINQYVLAPDTFRRVVLASAADEVIVKTLSSGATVWHQFDRGTWLRNTDPAVVAEWLARPLHDTPVLHRLGL